MTRFFQACSGKNCLIDRKTFKFCPQTSEALKEGIEVPFYLWYFKGADNHIWRMNDVQNVVFTKTDTIELNGLSVKLPGHDYKRGDIVFYDTAQKRQRELTITVQLLTGGSSHGIVLHGASFGWVLDDDYKELLLQYHQPNWVAPNFCHVASLGRINSGAIGLNTFSFGVNQEKYIVRYRGKKLNGSCYALLCGPWGILLDDDLQFDSLVILNGCTSAVLEIERVAYTVNPYVTKMVMLVR